MIFELIKKRRSVYPPQYNDKPVSREVVEDVLEAANWAPTHKRTEPWRFKVLLGDTKEKLGLFLAYKYMDLESKPSELKVKKIMENTHKAGAIIAICMQRDPKESLPEWEEIAATAMAVQNMWLCCTELGLGCYWSSPAMIAYMGEFFDMGPGEKCLGFFYMGYYDGELPEIGRAPVSSKVTWL